MSLLKEYRTKIRRFSHNARLFLIAAVLRSIGLGIAALFFNFYVLSLGYRREFLGLLISLPSITAIAVALPAGYLSDRIGRKATLVGSQWMTIAAQVLMLVWRQPAGLILSGVLQGAGQSFFRTAASPFLMEESSDEERTHLFSFSAGLRTLALFLGNTVGGYLPTLIALALGVDPTSSTAYAWALWAATLLMLIALIPFSRLENHRAATTGSPFSLEPFRQLWRQQRLQGLILPQIITSLGAGMLVPFFNLFFRERYGLPDAAIGTLFGVTTLGWGVATFLAPTIARRVGKIQTVILTRGLSLIPLIVLGYVHNLPLALGVYFIRAILMNLAMPVYRMIIVEETDESTRGMASGLFNIAWNSGRAITPAFSGHLQEIYGFTPVFTLAIAGYAMGTLLLYQWARRTTAHPA